MFRDTTAAPLPEMRWNGDRNGQIPYFGRMDEPTGPTAFILAGDDPSGTTNALVGRAGPGPFVELRAIGERGMSTPSEIREVMVHAILEEGSSNIRVHEVSKLVDTIYQALKAHRMIDPSKKKSKKKSK